MSAVQSCSLPHHAVGTRVKWNRWSKDLNQTVVVTGIVVEHRGRFITARMDPDGRLERTSCGCVVAA